MTMNLLIAGVGGQGILLCGKILGQYALQLGLDAKISEVHGMAQRGGSVVTNVRLGQRVFSPLIDPGGADAILSFEPMEALRYRAYLAPGGAIVTAVDRVMPLSLSLAGEPYPQAVFDELGIATENLYLIENAAALAQQAGSIRALNIVLLGAFCHVYGLNVDAMRQAVEASVKPQFREMNHRAFDLGMSLFR